MIPTDGNRCRELPGSDHVIEDLAKMRTLSVTQISQSGGSAFNLLVLGGTIFPICEYGIVSELAQSSGFRFPQVPLVTRQADPTERASSLAKKWAKEGFHKARKDEGVLAAVVERRLSAV